MSADVTGADVAGVVKAEASVEDAGETKGGKLTLAERFAIVDYMRSRPEPFVGESQAELARMVSDATGIVVSPSALRYMVDQLPAYKLAEKLVVREPLSGIDARLAAIDARLSELERKWKEAEAAANAAD